MHRDFRASEVEPPAPVLSANTLINSIDDEDELDKEDVTPYDSKHEEHPRIKQFLTHTFIYFFIDLCLLLSFFISGEIFNEIEN